MIVQEVMEIYRLPLLINFSWYKFISIEFTDYNSCILERKGCRKPKNLKFRCLFTFKNTDENLVTVQRLNVLMVTGQWNKKFICLPFLISVIDYDFQ